MKILKNYDYWWKLSELVQEPVNFDPDQISPDQYNFYAHDFFQKGVVKLMVANYKASRAFFRMGMELLKRKSDQRSEDYFWLYLVNWLQTNRPIEEDIYLSASQGARELTRVVLRYGIRDIYNLYTGLSFTSPESVEIVSGQQPYMKDKSYSVYPYKSTAVHMLNLCRKMIISGQYRKAMMLADSARKLCKKGLKKVPYVLAHEELRWSYLADGPQLEEQIPESEIEEYKQAKRRVVGNIPLLIRQAGILEMVSAKLLGDYKTLQVLDRTYFGGSKEEQFADFHIPFPDFDKSFDEFVDKVLTSEFQKGELPDPDVIMKKASDWFQDAFKKQSLLTYLRSDMFFQNIKNLLTPKSLKKPLKLIREFFDQQVNPLQKIESTMGLREELEWSLILRLMEIDQDNSLADQPLEHFLLDYLG